MSNDPWGTDSDPFDDGGFDGEAVASETAGHSFFKKHTVLLASSVVVATTALVVSLASDASYGTVGLAAVAYLLAVMADLFARSSRYEVRVYRRPLVAVGMRIATFVIALWVGWLAASSLAGSG